MHPCISYAFYNKMRKMMHKIASVRKMMRKIAVMRRMMRKTMRKIAFMCKMMRKIVFMRKMIRKMGKCHTLQTSVSPICKSLHLIAVHSDEQEKAVVANA